MTRRGRGVYCGGDAPCGQTATREAEAITEQLASHSNPLYQWEVNEQFTAGYTDQTETEKLFTLFDIDR